MPIPVNDQSKLLSAMQVVRPVFNIFPLESVATAEVDVTPTDYPLGSVQVKNTSAGWSDIRIGQAIKITDSLGRLVTYGVVRKAPTSTILYLDQKSRADGGQATNIAIPIEEDHVITVYSYQPLWALLSRIKNGVFYKQFDIPYDGSGSNPSPVCNIGSWRVAEADSTGYATLSFNNDNSFAWLSKTISTYSWVLPTGASLVSGTLTSASITVSVPEGFHLIRCTITDSGGATQTGTRPIWVNGSTFKPISETVSFEILSDSQDRTGRNMSVKFYGDIDNVDIMQGGAIILKEYSLFDDETMSDGVLTDTFVGLISDEAPLFDNIGGDKSVSFELKSPWSIMNIIPMVSQAILEKASPAKWTEVKTGLGTPSGIVWYILKHHSTYLDMFDFFKLPEATEPRKKNWGLNGSTITEYLEQCGKIIAGNIGCVSDGSLYLRRDPNIEDNTFRDALDVRMEINPDYLTEKPEISQSFFNKVGQLRAYALQYSGTTVTAYASMAPGYGQMQAPGKQEEESIILKTGGQTELNRICGEMLAKFNNPIPEISCAMLRNFDVLEPAKMVWFDFNLPASYNPRETDYVTRILPKTIERAWEESNGLYVKNITATFVPETFGEPGIKIPVEDDGGGGSDDNDDNPPVTWDPGNIENPTDPPNDPPGSTILKKYFGGIAIAWNEYGYLGRTRNGKNWDNIGVGLTGNVEDFDFDWFSPYAKSGYISGILGAWCITSNMAADPDKVRIYYTANVLDTDVVWTEQKNYDVVTSISLQGGIRIIASKEEEDFVAAAWREAGGTYVARTTNGSTWGTATLVGTGISSNSFLPMGMDIQGENVAVTAIDSDGFYKLWYCATKSSGFTLVANSEIAQYPYPVIEFGDNGDIYCTTQDNRLIVSDITYNVTFNGSGPIYSHPGMSLEVVSTPTNGYHGSQSYYNEWAATFYPPGKYITSSGSLSIQETGTSGPQTITASLLLTLPGRIQTKATGASADFTSFIRVSDMTLSSTNALQCVLYVGNYVIRTINLYDKNLSVLATYSTNTNDSPAFNQPLTIEGADISSSSLGNVKYLEVQVGVIGDLIVGGDFLGLFFDNLNVYTQSTQYETYKLWRVQNYQSGSASWTDITPTDGKVPQYHYGISADSSSSQQLNAVASNPADLNQRDLIRSSNYGTSWLDIESLTSYIGCHFIGNYGVLFGNERIDLTTTGLINRKSLVGDWEEAINSDLGLVRGVRLIF